MKYNWQQPDWPHFRWDLSGLESALLQFAELSGRIDGMLAGLPDNLQMDALVSLLVEEAIKTSAIEGEFISRVDVYSSVRRCLNLEEHPVEIRDMRARGISEISIDARKTFADPLSANQLFQWHAKLFSQSESHWRTHEEPMQVISGIIGKETVHFEAPPSTAVPQEMARYIKWFNQTAPHHPLAIPIPLVRAAIAHLYFESIHPFEDGNGRIGRVIAEKALAQGLGRPVMLSLSHAIEKNKKAYYEALKIGQRSNCITGFIAWFIQQALQAQLNAIQEVSFILKKTRFMDTFKTKLNARQTKIILRMLEAGPSGFSGGMNARKYISLTGVSKATATRDLAELARIGALRSVNAGRSTHYEILFQGTDD